MCNKLISYGQFIRWSELILNERIGAGRRHDNSRLVFEPGNQWGKDSEVAPFFVVPSWWRRFVFQILSAREFTVYCYIVGMTDRYGIAYPTVQQIQTDLGLGSRSIVSRAIDKIVGRGFLLRRARLVRGVEVARRAVYQRPHPAYTLLRLLDLELINAGFFPVGFSQEEAEDDYNASAVALGLQNVLGADLYQAYKITSAEGKLYMLKGLLKHRLSMSISKALSARDAVPEKLPPEISAALAADQGVPF
jgi:hypothetical protein